jgi:hypothetical protein
MKDIGDRTVETQKFITAMVLFSFFYKLVSATLKVVAITATFLYNMIPADRVWIQLFDTMHENFSSLV